MPEDSKASYIDVSPTCIACLSKREFIDSKKGKITLNNSEFKTLNCIIKKDGEVATKDEILMEVEEISETEFDKIKFYSDNTAHKRVSDVRRKIKGVFIETVTKVGYKWAPPRPVPVVVPADAEEKKAPEPGVRYNWFMTPQEAAEKIKICLMEFERSEDEDKSTKSIRTIMRLMNRLQEGGYENLRGYFEDYAERLEEIGQAGTVKGWLCCFMLLKFLREEYVKRLSEYEEYLKSDRYADKKEELQKIIWEMKDNILEIDMELDGLRRMIREKAHTQGRYL